MQTEASSRHDGRALDQSRPLSFTREVVMTAQGSCLVQVGNTKVLCTATVEDSVPGWLEGKRKGWVSAEYALLPTSCSRRVPREHGKRKGRSMEIERLIGRSLRMAVDLQMLGEHTVTVDCDVIQADGGTRTASICGGWVALHDALMAAVEDGRIARLPLTRQVAAISAGKVGGALMVDLDYVEDSHAEVDLNLVCSSENQLIEVQGTGERACFTPQELSAMVDLAQPTIEKILDLQNQVTGFKE